MNKDIAKRNAAEEAVKYVKNGMVVGLGTGSTAKIAVDLIGNKLNEDFKNYYISPGFYISFYNYCKNNNIDFQNITIELFLRDLILNYENKKNNFLKDNLIHFLEYFFAKKIKNTSFKSEIHDKYQLFTKKLYISGHIGNDLRSKFGTF